jgi:magnesium-transporting ATPase (P-type)
VRNMILPKEESSTFKKDSYKFIAFLGIITIFGQIMIATRFSGIMDDFSITFKALGLMTISIPPVLTLALSIGVDKL